MPSFQRTILVAGVAVLALFSFVYWYAFLSFTFTDNHRVSSFFIPKGTKAEGSSSSSSSSSLQQQQHGNNSNHDKNDTELKTTPEFLRAGAVRMRIINNSTRVFIPRNYTRVVALPAPMTPIMQISCEKHFKSISHDDDNENYNKNAEDVTCTPQQGSYQASNYCRIFLGRHNLKAFFTLIRLHLPNAKLLVDIGANKGLVSSRWLELWKPKLNHTPKKHADFVKQYIQNHVPPIKTRIAYCGVTNMCDQPNLAERAYLNQCAPIVEVNTTTQPQEEVEKEEAFEIYSFEPSPHLYQMQQTYMQNHASDALRAVWKWFPFAASDEIKQVQFEGMWNEGSRITPGALVSNVIGLPTNDSTFTTTTTTTWTVTLDSLANYHQQVNDEQQVNNNSSNHTKMRNHLNLFGNRTIDVLKIDAEGVDAAVLVGASHLLFQQRIRVIMWETPNVYPLQFPDWFGGVANNFDDLINRLDTYANMTCYFPGKDLIMIKLTKCWERYLSTAPKCQNLNIEHSNAICISRTKARSLYRDVESNALIHQQVEAAVPAAPAVVSVTGS